MEVEEFQYVVRQFIVEANVFEAQPFGNGHINDTFKVDLDTNEAYLLQRVNHNVFKDVLGVMSNIQKVTQHLTKKGKPTLHFLKTKEGKDFLKTANGNYWRMMRFEANTKSFEITQSHHIAEATGRAIANFQIDLADLDPNDFIDVIPLFHNLKDRLQQLDKAVADNKVQRLEKVQNLVEYSRSLRKELLAFYDEKELPIRITHNDTKLNNILFTATDEPLCLVDLDTVMPGFVHYDFGDVVRTMCNTVEDDETDLDKVQFNYKLYKSYKKGYLSVARSFLTAKEEEWLDISGKLMTYIMAIRFLADFLNGDVYYKINYPMHNYDRANCQFKLLKEMCKVL